MNLMFWKKKANADGSTDILQEETADKTVTRESIGAESADADSSDAEMPARAGVFAKITSRLAALISRFKKSPPFRAEEDQEPDTSEPSGAAEEDSPAPRPANLKKRLIIGGAISLIVILLAGIVFAIFKLFMPAPTPEPVAAEPARIARPVPQAKIPQVETDATQQKNTEPQAPPEEPKKEPPPEVAAEPQAGDSALSVSESGDITVDNKDPQAAALSLKEAIEAMNAGSGGYTKKKTK